MLTENDYRNQKTLDRNNERYEKALENFYPNSPRIAPTLPLANYTGTYFHPAYHNLTIMLKDGALAANRSDSAVRSLASFFFWLTHGHMSLDFSAENSVIGQSIDYMIAVRFWPCNY